MSLCHYVVKLHSDSCDNWRPSRLDEARDQGFSRARGEVQNDVLPLCPFQCIDLMRPSLGAQLAFKVAILEANRPAILNLCVSFRKMSPPLPLQSSSIYLMQLEMPNSGQSGSLADLNLKLSRRNVQQSALKPHLHETSESSIMLIVCHCSASLML